MNKRIDYLFKAIVLRILLELFRRGRIWACVSRDEKFEATVENLADECAAISDGRMPVEVCRCGCGAVSNEQ